MSETIVTPQNATHQGQLDWRESATIARIRRGLSITELAERIGHSRVATSQAINHGMNAGVIKAVCEELDLPLPPPSPVIASA